MKVTLQASDPDQIDDSSIQLKFNGTSVHPSALKVTHPQIGHWEQVWNDWDGIWETVWVVDGYDYTKATIEGQFWVTPSALPDKNAIWVRVADKLGNASVKEDWFVMRNAPPTITLFSPANGATANSAIPTISAKVTDNGGIDPTSIILKIDNADIASSFDASTGIVSAYPSAPLSAGRHDVRLEVKDLAGNTQTASWYFTIAQGYGGFYSAQPAQGSTVSVANPTIAIEATSSADIDINAVSALLNGVRVSPTVAHPIAGYYWNGQTNVPIYDLKKAIVSYQADVLADGNATFAISIADVQGRVLSYSWTFAIKAPPKITDPYPSNAIIKTGSPTISARVSDNGFIASASMLIDGVYVPAVYDAGTGMVTYIPISPLLNDAQHSVQLIVVDGVGASATLSWIFYVQTQEDMPSTGACTGCHTSFPVAHPMTNCNGCHGGEVPVQDCRGCHGNQQHTYEFLMRPTVSDHSSWPGGCEQCHNAAFSYKVPIHPSDLSALHASKTDTQPCKPCHAASLTIEHYKRTDANGNRYNCNACHASTRADVKMAIDSGKTNCDACHALGTMHSAAHESGFLDGKCATCHENNLALEHLDNQKTQSLPLTCSACHSNASSNIVRAISAGNRQCVACHARAHNVRFFEAVPADIPLYPGFSWEGPVEASVWSGEPWLPSDLADGKLLISSRRTDVAGDDVWAFYSANMVSGGWTLISEAPQPSSIFYSATFAKGTRRAMIWFYGAEAHDPSAPPLSSGYRIEIAYK